MIGRGLRPRGTAGVSFFASDRERRLWLWTLVVVVAIYATLGVTGVLAGELRDRGLLAGGFATAMVLVGATVLTQGLRTRPRGIEIAVALGVTVVYLMVIVRMALEERTHLIEYGVVAVLILEALAERVDRGRRVPLPAVLAIVATALLGAVDEGIQALIPTRVFDMQDIVFNTLAAIMAIAASLALGWARRLRHRTLGAD